MEVHLKHLVMITYGESGAHYAPIGAANGPTAADGPEGIGYGATSLR